MTESGVLLQSVKNMDTFQRKVLYRMLSLGFAFVNYALACVSNS